MKKGSNPPPPDKEKKPPPPPAPPKRDESLSANDLDLIRQWFNSLQDTNPGYLHKYDYQLAARIYEHLGLRVSNSIKEKLK